MKNYRKNTVHNYISVRSFQSFYYFKLDGKRDSSKDCHDFPEILYVDKGNHCLNIDDASYELNEGELIIYAPNAEHYSTTPQHSHIAIISFDVDSDMLSPLYNKVITLNSGQRSLFSKIITSGLKLFKPLPPDENDIGMTITDTAEQLHLQMLKNMLELLLLDLFTSSPCVSEKPCNSNVQNYRDNLVDSIVDFMKNNISSSITLSDICDNFRISVSTLKKIFKEHFNCGPKSYFTDLKIEEAKRMIRDTSSNFTEISTQLNFNSIHHFSKAFKEKTGSTPSEYAKSVYKK